MASVPTLAGTGQGGGLGSDLEDAIAEGEPVHDRAAQPASVRFLVQALTDWLDAIALSADRAIGSTAQHRKRSPWSSSGVAAFLENIASYLQLINDSGHWCHDGVTGR